MEAGADPWPLPGTSQVQRKKPNKNPKTKIKTPKGGKGAQYLPAGPHKRPEARGRGFSGLTLT